MRKTVLTASVCFLVLQALPASAQEMPKPGPEQARLHKFVGDWDVTVSIQGAESKAAATYKMGMGGFFLFEDFKGEFAGMKFQGKGTTGYDPTKKHYVSTWVDSMTPSILLMHGHFSKDGKTYTETGEGPGMDGTPTKMKSVFQFEGKDRFTFTMYQSPGGKESEVMKLTYTRKK